MDRSNLNIPVGTEIKVTNQNRKHYGEIGYFFGWYQDMARGFHISNDLVITFDRKQVDSGITEIMQENCYMLSEVFIVGKYNVKEWREVN